MSEKSKAGEPPITVLVADDDPDLRRMLQYTLDHAGFIDVIQRFTIVHAQQEEQ